MGLMLPRRTAQWVLPQQTGFDSLVLQNDVPIPQLRADEVLIKLHAASINYRDLVMAKVRFHRPQSLHLGVPI